MPHQPPDPPTSAADPPPCSHRLTLTGAPHGDGTHTCDRPAGHLGGHRDSRSSTTWPDVEQRSIYQPSGYVPPPPANPLADDIRGIARLHPTEQTSALHDLADRVERYTADDPHAVTADQVARADALSSAARLLAPLLSQMSLSGVEANIDGIAAMWLRLAEQGTGLIRDGSRP